MHTGSQRVMSSDIKQRQCGESHTANFSLNKLSLQLNDYDPLQKCLIRFGWKNLVRRLRRVRSAGAGGAENCVVISVVSSVGRNLRSDLSCIGYIMGTSEYGLSSFTSRIQTYTLEHDQSFSTPPLSALLSATHVCNVCQGTNPGANFLPTHGPDERYPNFFSNSRSRTMDLEACRSARSLGSLGSH